MPQKNRPFVRLIWPVFLSLLLAVASQTKISHSSTYRRLSDLLANNSLGSSNFSSVIFDQLHESIVLDQLEHYIRPVKSLATRNVHLLNGLYDFCLDPQTIGFEAKWQEGALIGSCQESHFFRMPVPAAFNDIPSSDQVRDYMGWMWYQTEIPWSSLVEPATGNAGAGGSNSTWLIQFESINYLCIIWLQVRAHESELVGAHVGGHLPVVVDIGGPIRRSLGGAGKGHEPEREGHLLSRARLTIAVSNMLSENTIPSGRMVDLSSLIGRPYRKFQPDFDFFHFAGLLGDVQLIRLPPLHFESITWADIGLDSDLYTGFDICFNRPVGLGSLEPNENSRRANGRHTDAADAQLGIDMTILVDGIPFNYPISNESLVFKRRTLAGGSHETLCYNTCHERLDCYNGSSFAEWPDLERRATRYTFRLNQNQPDSYEVRLVSRANVSRIMERAGGQLQGFGMHQEELFGGRSMGLAAIMKDLYLVRRLNANVLRTSHYPYSRAYLEACDELGLAVIAESAAVGLRSFGELKLRLHQQLLLEMMERDREQPAIIMWSVANEPASQLPAARDYFRRLLEFARKELAEVSGGRPLTAAIAQSHADDRVADLLDVVMVNKYLAWYEHPGVLEAIGPGLLESLLGGWARRLGPGKPLLVSEFGAETLAGLHSMEPGRRLFSEEFQCALIEEHERTFEELADNRTAEINFWGALIWNFADFSTHESIARVDGNKKGVFTRERRPKLAAASIERTFKRRRRRRRRMGVRGEDQAASFAERPDL